MPDLKTPFRLFLKYSVQVRVGHGQPEKRRAVSYSCQHGIHKNERWSKSTNTDVFCERNVVTSCRINSHLSGGRSQSDCHVLWRICTCINMFFPWSTCRKSGHQTWSVKVKRFHPTIIELNHWIIHQVIYKASFITYCAPEGYLRKQCTCAGDVSKFSISWLVMYSDLMNDGAWLGFWP